MVEPAHRLRHLPFFEEIALHEEGEPLGRSATAGLLVLRLVDAWLESAPLMPDVDFGARHVRTAVDAMSDGIPVKSLLFRVVDALQEQRPDIHVVVTPLMAYAQALEFDAKWLLAADVYQSVLTHLHPTEDGDAVIAANLRLGQCYRNLNLVDAAAAAFRDASGVANVVGDMVGALRARIGEARVAFMRGNHPMADKILEETVVRAQGADMSDVRSRALHDRAEIAIHRGDYERSIRLAYQAIRLSQAPSERDRILIDIAGAFSSLGVYSAARDAYLVLSVTAQEQYVRWLAQLNLIELAADTNAEVVFEQYRRDLEGVQLPPFLGAALQVAIARGFHRFGRSEQARERLRRAQTVALEHSLNLVYFKAEELFVEIEKAAPPPRESSPVPLDLEEVASAIRGLRDAIATI